VSTHISKSQFKARALEYFRQIETDGRPVVVTDHGEPRLEVRRYRPQAREPLALLRGSLLRFEAPTEPVADEDWEATR
jgi:hypothetical protein